MILAASMMKVDLVTTFIGKNKNKTVDENIALMKEAWPPILKLAEEKGVRIAIENCPMLYTEDEWPGGNNVATTPYVWREMFRMSPNIGLCYDPSHLVLQGMTEWKPVTDFPDRIFHVHLKDIRIDQEMVEEYGRFSYPSLWHRPKMPGLGEVDFPGLITRLMRSDIREMPASNAKTGRLKDPWKTRKRGSNCPAGICGSICDSGKAFCSE